MKKIPEMTNKDKLILIALISAVGVIGLYSYSYVFLDMQISQAMSDLHAPANYQRLALILPEQSLKLTYNGEEFIIQPATLRTWLEGYNRDYTGTSDLRPNVQIISSYLDKIAPKLNAPPINASLDYQDGKIVQFSFPTKGLVLSNGKTIANIVLALSQKKPEAELVFDEVDPQVTMEQINNLGIKKLLGRGESDFSNSSAARITNIKVSSRLFNGTLIKPGEEFSFNKILGDVDAVNGYLPELVIKNHSLVKEYGGGICQVATTVFRAAIFAGLKITERHPHAFPVSHYNPQGFDATIYPGSADLRFINDTPNNILVQTNIKGHKIYFDFYGNDDKIVTVTNPVQYDIKTDGSMKAVFSRTIVSSTGEITKEDFRSVYRSPALFPTLRNPLE